MNYKGQALIESVIIINIIVLFIVLLSTLISISSVKLEVLINTRNSFFNKKDYSDIKVYNIRVKKKIIRRFWKNPLRDQGGVIENEYSGIF